MRCKILVTSALSLLLVGATCVPLLDLDPDPVAPTGTTLSVSVMKPDADREVPMGTEIGIEWAVANLTGSEAIVTILARSRNADLPETILAGGVRLSGTGGTETFTWYTGGNDPDDSADDFEGGDYSVVVRVEADGLTKETSAPGRITINTPPSFEFTEPEENAELIEQVDPNDPNSDPGPASITIAWDAFDPDGDGKVEISVDPDSDASAHDSGNETVIDADRVLPEKSGFGSLDWEGTDSEGVQVDPGTYYVFAVLTDEMNEEQVVSSTVQLTVPEWPEEYGLAITDPNEDTTFLTTDAGGLTIKFTLDEADDVLIDLEVDTDDDHKNGNEILILSQRLIEADTHESSFVWNGKDTDDNDVADGIHRILLVVSRETGAPQLVEADHLVFRRSEENQPLIALLEPSTDETVEAGADVVIKWRDEDPDETSKIRLWLDDDDIANEVPEEGKAPFEILPEPRGADDDGVQDQFRYHVPDTLDFGRYYVRAHIDRDDAGGVDHTSEAAGQIVLEDPDAD